jgi:hypothetical protein
MNNSLPQHNPGLLSEVGSFLRRKKKWYLVPIVIVIVITCLFIVLGGTAVAPFIYTLF